MQHIVARSHDRSVPPFTKQTYALLGEYAREGHIPPLRSDYFVGDASGIVLASDGLIAFDDRPSWDQCDADALVATAHAFGMHAALATMTHAVLAFRRWLRDSGRGNGDGIDSLERLDDQLARGELDPAPTASRTTPRPSRAERRAAASEARKHARRHGH